MNYLEIREKFLNYFQKNGHTIVPSSPVIPAEDPTLLFTNAGMNQFKDIFLGKEKRSYTRATSIQKCVRAGGKHNDLDEVGYTERHLTFFEMMGNFSFGDYFKKEAIAFAWDLLTKEMGLPAEKLYPTVFREDDEAFEIWNKIIGVPVERITRLGEKDNFWQMGDTGPCGPCTEILIDRGADKGCLCKDCKPGCSCARYTEIWNLVFMQFNRQADGKLIPLTQTGVDTGMGFERLCMVKQNKNTVFEIDLFQAIHRKTESLTGLKYDSCTKEQRVAFNVLSDHVRASSLIIADGGTPSNDGRGYVLRKIIRRASLFAQKLSDNQNLFPEVAKEFIKIMSPIYPELKSSEKLIINLVTNEIEKFSTNLVSGQNILDQFIADNLKSGEKILTGIQVFKLYDTYGFPPELTRIIAGEKNVQIDMDGFEKEMQKQKDQSGKKCEDASEEQIEIPASITTKFVGYDQLEVKSKIVFEKVCGNKIWIVTAESPFYVESGGQAGDCGFVSINNQIYPVVGSQKNGSAIALKISTEKVQDPGTINVKVGDIAHLVVDSFVRDNSAKNHTATHLLQTALRQIVGKEVKQAGSLVSDKLLRFDFNYHQGLSDEQIEQIETLVNQKIQENLKVHISNTTLTKAKESGVTAFFGEKYNPENVRVVDVSGFSAELCGGTHVDEIGKIGCFKILSEASLSAGVRRIIGVTGSEAIKLFQQIHNITKNLNVKFKVQNEQILQAVERQSGELEETHKTIKSLRKEFVTYQIPQWQNQMKNVGNIPFLFLELEDQNNNDLKQICAKLETKTPGLLFLISSNKTELSKINFFCSLSKAFAKNIDLKKLALFLKSDLNLQGGGSGEVIQGGGENQSKIKSEVEKWILENQV
ncbi:TPA: alanine--tRNA ligase [Candidatus Dependentiae bacterium]|nr:MAG: Alanine-tRNA ligase [candidate division TM6 bacterium GW2011_GWE2_31_21]KKP52551.1 MAG: Alanine-tRNA ligase [candidate division TM6 bacterium GW2011_GWF2_33_332]HBS48457.1 alanine--tRNA ligase [Candidatus Dependentiae bacterium]HBZ73306.1 alanine--tRNA ligase [Candidatus Dependentiae bacterium]